MSKDCHAVVWVDHSEAKVFRFSADDDDEVDVHSHTSRQWLHHSRTGWEAGGNRPDNTGFFKRVVSALDHAGGTVITGPGNPKSSLKTFLDHARPHSDTRVFAVESLGHPDAGASLALGAPIFSSCP